MKLWLPNAFIFSHLTIMLFWGLPGETKLRREINRFFEPYTLYFGLWQSWDMFAPNPRDIQITMDAEITYEDGRVQVWEFPRMDKMGFWEKFRKERYRKWAHDNVRVDSHSALWLPTVRYIARTHDDPNRPIKRVDLKRRWRQILIPVDSTPLIEPPWNEVTFFSKTFGGKHD